MISNKGKPLGYLLLLACFGGSASSFMKIGLGDIPPFGFSFIRLVIGTLIAYGMLRMAGRSVSWKNFKLFTPIATLWWLNTLVFTVGMQWTTPPTAQFIHIAIPILTAVIAGVLLKQRINKHQWIGIFIAAFGVGLVIFSKGELSLTSKHLTGNLLILVSAFLFSFYAAGGQLSKYRHIHAFEMNFIVTACGIIASMPLAVWEYSGNKWTGAVPTPAWLALLGASVVLGIFHGGFQWLINKFGPAYATLNLYLLPGFVVVWASLLLHEKLAPISLLGATIALIGVWVVTSQGKKSLSPLIATPE